MVLTNRGGLSLVTGRCFVSLPVISVASFMCFVYYTVVFLVIGDESWRRGALFHVLLFTWLTFMAMLSYALSIFRDPGSVPHTYMLDIEVHQHQNPLIPHQVKPKGGEPRYCQKCDAYKPVRAHHCRVCKRCVLKMDHHCTWINNCVGHNNYKTFFLFIFYVVLASSYALILIANHAMNFLEDTQRPLISFVSTSTILKVACSIILAPLSIALIVLLGWHIYLLLNNTTTIEESSLGFVDISWIWNVLG